MKKTQQKANAGLSRRLRFPEDVQSIPWLTRLLDAFAVVDTGVAIACRQYNVFTTPCAPDEDHYYKRRSDVLVSITDYTDRAFAAVVKFCELERERDVATAVRLSRARIMNLQKYDWKGLIAMWGPKGDAS